MFQFQLWYEQKPGQGEDAEPILLKTENSGLLAVFDGMGGAGGAQYAVGERTHTGAYLASRYAKESVLASFGADLPDTGLEPEYRVTEIARALRDNLAETFKEKAALLGISDSKLGGKMIRRLPTTMTVIYYETEPVAGDPVSWFCFWAGDSRGYIVSPAEGLQQLSIDDLKSGGDALANLTDDSPLSNCISLDEPFRVSAIARKCPQPVVFIAATDGCFNFFRTPAHFEEAILTSLARAATASEWRDNISQRLRSIAGDDFSMAVICLGWETFDALKNSFLPRQQELLDGFIRPLDLLEEEIAKLQGQLNSKTERWDDLRNELWSKYRVHYELYRRPNSRSGGGK